MGRAYSGDLRDRISAHIASGHSRRAAARRFGVSPSCAIKLMQHVAKTGSAAPRRQGRPSGAGKLAGHVAQLIRWVEATPDITMPELAARLEAETKVVAHPASLSRVLVDAMMSARRAGAGASTGSRNCVKRRTGWCSSTKPRPPRK